MTPLQGAVSLLIVPPPRKPQRIVSLEEWLSRGRRQFFTAEQLAKWAGITMKCARARIAYGMKQGFIVMDKKVPGPRGLPVQQYMRIRK